MAFQPVDDDAGCCCSLGAGSLLTPIRTYNNQATTERPDLTSTILSYEDNLSETLRYNWLLKFCVVPQV